MISCGHMFRGLHKFIGESPCNTTINVTSKLNKGKMLMFAKVSLKSFVYNITHVFCFPTEEVKMIYDK